MTAEEREKAMLSTISKGRDLSASEKVIAKRAYEAGRSSMQEEAARLAVLRMLAWTTEDDKQSQQFRDGIEKACSDLAAAIRALKP